ncbi:hypothetical protein BpHYR1_032253 [Brachionus plicatilis]|uniref:Uncharacterized protein n=1 Tax=Brachionus plicatilis TaxID=10195 RepID=A0A3M7PBU4_BRAPC|nr:hypothetical protein BpHYR1_032253 [Brachionus plicatilis]
MQKSSNCSFINKDRIYNILFIKKFTYITISKKNLIHIINMVTNLIYANFKHLQVKFVAFKKNQFLIHQLYLQTFAQDFVFYFS